MARFLFLFGLNVQPVAITKFVGTVSLGLLTGLSYTTTTLTLPSLHLLPSATTASNTIHHLRTSTSVATNFLCQLTTLSLAFAYLLSPGYKRHPFLLYAAFTTALPLALDGWNDFAAPTTSKAAGGRKDGRISMRDVSLAGRKGSHSSASDEEWEVDASGMRGGGGGAGSAAANKMGTPEDSGEEEEGVNGESVREGMRSWGQDMARRGAFWGVGFAIAVVGIWGDAGY